MLAVSNLDSDEEGDWNYWDDKSANVRLIDVSEDFDKRQRKHKISQWTFDHQSKLEWNLCTRRNKINWQHLDTFNDAVDGRNRKNEA